MNESFKEKIFEQIFATSKLQNLWLVSKKFSDEKFQVLVSSFLNPFFSRKMFEFFSFNFVYFLLKIKQSFAR